MNMNFSGIYSIIMILLLIPVTLPAKIAEKELERHNELFMETIIRETPHLQKEITTCLNTSLSDSHSGSRLLDRFGIFMNNCQIDNMAVTKTRFFYWRTGFALFIVLADSSDGQVYTLYLEYLLDMKEKSSRLRDLYFSPVFTEKVAAMKLLFGNGEMQP